MIYILLFKFTSSKDFSKLIYWWGAVLETVQEIKNEQMLIVVNLNATGDFENAQNLILEQFNKMEENTQITILPKKENILRLRYNQEEKNYFEDDIEAIRKKMSQTQKQIQHTKVPLSWLTLDNAITLHKIEKTKHVMFWDGKILFFIFILFL